jgi:glycerol-3-phosphate dehydrogenase
MGASRRIGHDELVRRGGPAAASGYDDGLVYYDCQMYAPERLGLECLKQACLRGAAVANYTEAVAVSPGRVDMRDTETGEEASVSARVVVNAAGPWADIVMDRAAGSGPRHALVRAKGIHLIVRPLTDGDAIAVFTGSGHFFVLPWRGHTILGTTDDAFAGPPDEVTPLADDVARLLALVNEGLPGARLTEADVLHAYAGVRPLVAEGRASAQGSYKQSRKAAVIDHEAEGGQAGFVSAIGGKWTTSRDVAAQAVDLVERKLGRTPKRAPTHLMPLTGKSVGNLAAYTARAQDEHKRVHPSVVANLVRNYGTAFAEVIDAAAGDRALLEPLSDRLPECGAQIVHAARSEMAMTLEDAVFRRTGLGTLGHPGDAALSRAAYLMAQERGWSAARQNDEVDAVLQRFPWGAGSPSPR